MSNAVRSADPWHIRVLAALAEFPDGTTIARLTRPLTDGTRDYTSVHRRIYRALRTGENRGHVRRASRPDQRAALAWGVATASHSGWYGHSPITWQVTTTGADYLARHHIKAKEREDEESSNDQ